MRILFDVTTASSGVPGLTTYVSRLLDAWKEVGPKDEFLVLLNNDAPQEISEAAKRAGQVKVSGRQGAVYRLAVQQSVLPYLIRTFSPHVLLAAAPDLPPLASFGVPAVTVVHDMRHLLRPAEFSRLQLAYRRFAHEQSFRRSAALIAISKTTAQLLNDLFPGTGSKTVVAYHGADHVKVWPAHSAGKQAVAFGQWANKRPEFAMRVWAGLQREIVGFDWRLNVVGARDEMASRLNRSAEELGISQLVQIHEYLPAPAFQKLFASSSLLLFPSSDEGFGLPIVEAMGLGIPVVASDLPISREIGGPVACYVDVSSERAMIECCATLINDAERRCGLAAAGREWVARFTWRSTAEQTREALLAASINRRGA